MNGTWWPLNTVQAAGTWWPLNTVQAAGTWWPLNTVQAAGTWWPLNTVQASGRRTSLTYIQASVGLESGILQEGNRQRAKLLLKFSFDDIIVKLLVPRRDAQK